MQLSSITPLILTYNEESNIRRCLERLVWASRVVVIDSGSTDETLSICGKFPNVEVIHRDFDNHTAQWNHGLVQVQTPWALTLDADYLLNDEFTSEVQSLPDGEAGKVWFGQFHYKISGRRLRGTLYPPRALLFDPRLHQYEQDGHTQSLRIQSGEQQVLKTRIDHDDRKPLSRWLDSQRKYARLEADKMSRESKGSGMPDRLRRRIWPAVPAAFLYTLFVKRLILDGWPGLFYVLQRTYAELLLSLELLERKLR
jgi:glycosyltransferase involved in cell wall biosynthesis